MLISTADQKAALPEIESPGLQAAALRSECARVVALLTAFVGLLAVLLIRGVLSLSSGHRGEAWPFAVLLAVMAAYELVWLRAVKQAIATGRTIPRSAWMLNILIESMNPTIALFLQIYTPSFGPERTLSSPIILLYLIFTILSTLRLDPALARLSGLFSAAGYSAAALYILVAYPEISRPDPFITYGSFLSTVALLLVGGFAAGAVAGQIRLHVVAALRDAENRAKIAQLEHDLGMARSIQQGLLPTAAPSIPGFDVAGWNQPADETGGDYFDWQPLADGRLAVTVADVTGHGIGSALIMSACRAYSRAGMAADANLTHLLDHLNRLLHEDLPPEKFVTLAAGLLDPYRGEAQLISAGHGPLIYYHAATDSFQCFDAQGPPLGLLSTFHYGEAHSLPFGRGDILALVTDGFLEWSNAEDEEFGLNRLQDEIRANRERPPSAIISEMKTAITRFVGGVRQSDDLTALVIKKV